MNLLSKILSFFGNKISERQTVRIDSSKINKLNLYIDKKSFKINDISLGGLSFINENSNLSNEEVFNVELQFNNDSVSFQFQIKRIDDKRISGQTITQLEDYQNFLAKHLFYIIPNQI